MIQNNITSGIVDISFLPHYYGITVVCVKMIHPTTHETEYSVSFGIYKNNNDAELGGIYLAQKVFEQRGIERYRIFNDNKSAIEKFNSPRKMWVSRNDWNIRDVDNRSGKITKLF